MRDFTLFVWLVTGLFATGFLACQSKEVATVQTGPLTLVFDNVVGNQDLKLNTSTYQNEAGESFVLTKFNYFVSNFRLKKEDGSDYVVPQDKSYFLVQEDKPASQTLTLAEVPTGNYSGVSFVIGVDSLRSLADISKRTGVLDPGLGTHDAMYWEWNSGYIFLKLEGTSPVAPAGQNNLFFYHIGGFGGGYNSKKTINNLRTVTLSFKQDGANVGPTTKSNVYLITDVLKVFNGVTKLSIAQHSSVMFETYSTTIADNYAQMIRVDRVQAN